MKDRDGRSIEKLCDGYGTNLDGSDFRDTIGRNA